MHLIKIEFLHEQPYDKKDPLDDCITLYPEIDSMWMPMSVFICDKIEVYLKNTLTTTD